ncbi:MAG: sigma 54-interacting transcriptional regulator [Deltaproteobacteria bacterium]|nr:sigma 54-interacting transcriptional regulator [Deltaproteobacteria bacterium]
MASVAQSKMLLDAIANNKYIGMTIFDKEGIIVFRNKGSEELSGIKNEEVLGKHFSILRFSEDLYDILSTGKPKLGTPYPTKTGDQAILHRIPLYDSTEIIGAMTIITFKDTAEIKEILRRYHLIEDKLQYYEKELQKFSLAKHTFKNIIGSAKSIVNQKKLARKYAKTHSPVFISGDTGTGKELFAHAIHLHSSRKRGPFIRVNCGAIPDELLESELFGYEPGAFTGASKKGKIGKFELADSGTIFLDEIGSMSLEMQAKILRVLEEKELERLGGTKSKKIDFRVISATNQNLENLIKKDLFRLDLYYRLVVVSIHLPPLIKRKGDIPKLCDHFIRSINEEIGTSVKGIDRKSMDILIGWKWPGNLRELRNVIERAANVCEDGVIKTADLPDYLTVELSHGTALDGQTARKTSLKQFRNRVEKEMLRSTLERTNWNKSKTARLLGISRPLLYAMIKRHELKKPDKNREKQDL